jgi:rusticyanin
VKRILTLLFIALATSAAAKAHSPFTLVSSEKKTIKAAEMILLQKGQTIGTKLGTQLAFTESTVRLVIFTGPEDDMLSYQIQGMRNPTLVVPTGVTMRILFVNVDQSMRHDVRFAHMMPPFDVAPAIDESAGSTRLTAKAEDGTVQAEEIVIKANSKGEYVYFCSVRTHAKGGMWGNIAVGVRPGANVKPPEKTEHVHSADEDHDHPDPKPAASPRPSGHEGHGTPKATPTPPGHDGHVMPKATPTPMAHDGHQMPIASPTPHAHRDDAKPADHSTHSKEMSSTVDINDPMNREGSGTAWLPDSTPMHAYTKMYKDGGMLMLMGSAFLRYTQVGSTRDISASGKGGRARVDAPNMFMAMYSRPLSSKSQLGLRVMASLDPTTQRGYGYPLLYQSGEL